MIFGPVTSLLSKTHRSLLGRLTLLVAIIALLQTTQAMHLHLQTVESNSNVYNKNLYLQELNSIQNRFKSDLEAIKAKFTKINEELKQTNASSSSQVIKLQETLAEERDALYNVQKYLSLPFALKSCECLNFTDAQKKQLQGQIETLTKQIDQLKLKLQKDTNGKTYENPQCPAGDCPVVKQIRRQIGQLQDYANLMTKTVKSQCCSKIDYLFRDNLAEYSLWIYGKLTQKQYRDHLVEREKKGKMATCPKSLPFVDEKLNECFICPKDKPIFSLETRTCVQPCEQQKKILDINIHQCDFNRTCEAGKLFSNKTLQCELDLGTSSRCPQDLPVWNDETLSCQKCSSQHPFYDINVRSCRSCTDNEVWDAFTMACINKANYHPVTCPNGSHYNSQTKQCDHNNGTSVAPEKPKDNTTPPSAGTSALCPPDTPYWDAADFVCSKCPTETPFYNETSKKCEACTATSTWNFATKTCIEKSHNCSSTQYWNTTIQKCEEAKTCNANEVYNKQTGKCQTEQKSGQVGVCPPATPFWNDQNLDCEKCPLATPSWNEATKKCEACPSNSAFDVATQKCQNNITCQNGTVFNSSTKKCESISCPSDKPLFDAQKGSCEPCPSGTIYNVQAKACQAPTIEGKSSVCPADKPYWDAQRLACMQCPSSQSLNQTTKKCQAAATTSHFSMLSRHNLERGGRHI